jgi:hypothetical protein
MTAAPWIHGTRSEVVARLREHQAKGVAYSSAIGMIDGIVGVYLISPDRKLTLIARVLNVLTQVTEEAEEAGRPLPERAAGEPWQPAPAAGLPAREVYERDDPVTGGPLPEGVFGFHLGGGAR